MEYVYPSYYQTFQCIGGACPDTCCAGWEIVIDDKSLERYKKYPDGFGNRLRNSIDFKKKSFKQYDRRCAFLNEDNLCDIYSEAGQGMLCRTCRMYPRHVEDYENIRELSLSLSCPEAARLILTQDKLVLKHREKETSSEDYGDFDDLLFSQLLDVRQVLLQIVQDESLDIDTRKMMILSLAHHLQKSMSEGMLFGMEDVCQKYLKPGAGERCRNYMVQQMSMKDADRFTVMQGMFDSLRQLEVLSAGWPDITKHCENVLFGKGREQYQILRKYRLSEKIQEQLLSYFIYVYFAGAVYDGRPYVKVKLAVTSVMMIEDMLSVTAAEKGSVSLEDIIESAHRYAREVEHSDINLNKMAEMLSQEKCYHIRRLIAALAE